MKELPVTIEIRRKGKWFLASVPELDFVSHGKTFEEAKKTLLALIRIQFQEMRAMGTLDGFLATWVFHRGKFVINSYDNAEHVNIF